MNASQFLLRKFAAILAFAIVIGEPQLASAVNLAGYVSNIQQFGSGSAFHHGHTVMASTNFSTLTAGGTYSAQCNHPATLPVTGERSLSSGNIGGNTLYVTVPQNLPALSNITGWNQVGAETELACNYRWTSYAQEGGFSIGAGGISFVIGSGLSRAGGTVDFTMYRRNTGPGGGGCGP